MLTEPLSTKMTKYIHTEQQVSMKTIFYLDNIKSSETQLKYTWNQYYHLIAKTQVKPNARIHGNIILTWWQQIKWIPLPKHMIHNNNMKPNKFQLTCEIQPKSNVNKLKTTNITWHLYIKWKPMENYMVKWKYIELQQSSENSTRIRFSSEYTQ